MAEVEVKPDVSTFDRDLDRLRQDVSKLSNDLKKVVQGGAVAGRAKAIDEFGNLYEQVKDTYDMFKKESVRAKTGLEKEVEERPFTILVGAFVVGIVLGKLMSSR